MTTKEKVEAAFYHYMKEEGIVDDTYKLSTVEIEENHITIGFITLDSPVPMAMVIEVRMDDFCGFIYAFGELMDDDSVRFYPVTPNLVALFLDLTDLLALGG